MYKIKLRINLIQLFHNSFVLIKTATCLPFYDEQSCFSDWKNGFFF